MSAAVKRRLLAGAAMLASPPAVAVQDNAQALDLTLYVGGLDTLGNLSLESASGVAMI